MEFRMETVQTQRLVMTTQMQLALDVLQYSVEELHEYLADLYETNPFLDFTPAGWHPTDSVTRRMQRRERRSTSTNFVGDFQTGRNFYDELKNHIRDQLTGRRDLVRGDSQVAASLPDHALMELALTLVTWLDENGYLRESDEAIASHLRLSVNDVSAARALLQSCEPRGLAAKCLEECLLLQVESLPDRLANLASSIIASHLDDVAHGRLPRVAKSLRVSVLRVQEAVDAIRNLNPRPASRFQRGETVYVIPDVVVDLVGDSYHVWLNRDCAPSVRVCQSSVASLRQLRRHAPDDYRDALAKVQSVRWLCRCLSQRKATLEKTAAVIVEWQRDFLQYGPEHLVPLTLRDVAAQLGMHESTISRTIRGKYMRTPRGVFELKYFFSAEVSASSGVTSAEAVRSAIRRIIRDEDAANPLSDEQLREVLSAEGITVSRRTIAKYREELDIPSSQLRRRYG